MNKERIIDYLYGEMDASERERFEIEMNSDAGLRNEVESLSQVRSVFSHDMDAQVTQPVIQFPAKSRSIPRSWMAAAASIVLLLTLGKITDFQVSTEEGRLVMGFGEIVPQEKHVEEPVINSISKADLDLALESLKSSILEEFNTQARIPPDVLSKEEYNAGITSMKNMIQASYDKSTVNMIAESTALQDEKVGQMMNEFIEYLDARRNNDIQVINTGLNNLAQMIQTGYPQFANIDSPPIQK